MLLPGPLPIGPLPILDYCIPSSTGSRSTTFKF
jgi:hypothetical protein